MKKITDAKLKKKINTFCKGEFESWHWMYISKYRWALKSGPWTAVKWQHFFLYLHPSFSKWRKLHWGDTNSLSQVKLHHWNLKFMTYNLLENFNLLQRIKLSKKILHQRWNHFVILFINVPLCLKLIYL